MLVAIRAMRFYNSFELRYIFVKMYRENRYIVTGTFRYIFGIGIGSDSKEPWPGRSTPLDQEFTHCLTSFNDYMIALKLCCYIPFQSCGYPT